MAPAARRRDAPHHATSGAGTHTPIASNGFSVNVPSTAITLDDSSAAFSSGGPFTASSRGLDGTAQIGTAGNSVADWTTTLQPGLYDFAVTWAAGSGLSTQVNYAVNDANYNTLGFGYINQTAAPNQFSDEGVAWNRLGTFRIASPTTVHVVEVNGTSRVSSWPTQCGSCPSARSRWTIPPAVARISPRPEPG